MESKFDPYRKWLGIAPKDQPPNNYRLLGIDLFEEDPDVISNAADQRMSHVRTFQTGKNGDISQRILGELSNAKITLLDRKRKGEYDAELKQQLAATAPPPAPRAPARPMSAPPPVSNGSGVALPSVRAVGSPVATATAFEQPQAAGVPIIQAPAGVATRGGTATTRARRKKNNTTPLLISAALVVMLLVVAGVTYSILSGGGSKPDEGKSPPTNVAAGGGAGGTGSTNGGTTDKRPDGGTKWPTIGESGRTSLSISTIEPQSVAPSQELQVVVRADGSRLTYLLEEAPPGARLDSSSGVFSWRPLGKRPGEEFYVTVKVSDPQGRAATTRFPVKIVEEELIEGGGLKAEFFADRELTQYVNQRVDPQVNFLWYKGAPAPGVPDDNFSVRWTGWLMAPQAGEYVITAFVDDGVRLWIDDQLVLDHWEAAAARQLSETVPLAAGPHQWKVEYFEASGDATIQLRWHRPDGVDEIVPTKAFRLEKPSSGGDFELPTPEIRRDQGLTAEIFGGGDLTRPVKSYTESNLDWSWTEEIGEVRVVEGPFAAKLTGTIAAPREGRYQLICSAVGRVQIEIDGERVLAMGDAADGENERTARVELSESPQPIRIALITGSGAGHFSLRWLRPGEDDENRAELIPPDFLKPAQPAAEPPPMENPPTELTAADQRARLVAAGIFRLGGSLRLEGAAEPIATLEALPPGPLNVVEVDIANDAVGDRQIDVFLAFPNLQKLVLGSESLTDQGLAAIAELKQLQELELRTPQVTDTGLRQLAELPQLKRLYIESASISNRVFVALKRMPALESLALTADRLTGDNVNELRDMPSLQQLTIVSGGLRDADLKGFRTLNQLQILALNGPLSGEGLANMSGLEVPLLSIASDRIDDADLVHLGRFPNLRALRLVSADLGDEACYHLMNCPQLLKLELLNAGSVSATGLQRLLRSQQLESILVRGADLSDEELEEVRGQTKTAIAIE